MFNIKLKSLERRLKVLEAQAELKEVGKYFLELKGEYFHIKRREVSYSGEVNSYYMQNNDGTLYGEKSYTKAKARVKELNSNEN